MRVFAVQLQSMPYRPASSGNTVSVVLMLSLQSQSIWALGGIGICFGEWQGRETSEKESFAGCKGLQCAQENISKGHLGTVPCSESLQTSSAPGMKHRQPFKQGLASGITQARLLLSIVSGEDVA